MFGKKKVVIAASSTMDLDDDAQSDEATSKVAAKTATKPTAKGGPVQPLKSESIPSAAKDAAVQGVMQIAMRNEYYRDQFRKAWSMIFVMSGILFFSVMLNIIQFSKRETPLPIAVTPDGRVFAITPLSLDSPLGPNGVAQWAARVVPSLYKLNFTDYREQLGDLEKIFTKSGYKGYIAAIERMQMVDLIKNNNYLVHAAPREAPQVVKTGELNGAKMWEVRAPIIVTFDNGTNPTTQTLVVTAWIVRVPESENPLGLAIQSFSAARG